MSRSMVGVDLGGTNCRGALVSESGEIGKIQRISTNIEEGLTPFLDRLSAFCRSFLKEAARTEKSVCALGIGVPGVIASDGTVVTSPNLPALGGVHLGEYLENELGLPVTLVNDANAIAWGESLFGAGKPFSSSLTLTLGTGVGGCLILQRKVWEGADGAAGEAGHIMVEPQGRPCGCGSRGCLEQYASATGIVKSVEERLSAGEASLLSNQSVLTSHGVYEAACEGDRVALAAFDEAGLRLGQTLAAIANLLNLEGVVITGGASESLDFIRPALERELKSRGFDVPVRRLTIVRGALGDDAGILGAARFAYDRMNPERKSVRSKE
jgi:glucokinase